MARLKPVHKRWLALEDEQLITARLDAPGDVSLRTLSQRLGKALGRTEESVIQRYGRLRDLIDERHAERAVARDLSRTPGRCRKGTPINRRGPRKCLCCGTEFISEGPHNRLCQACRHIDVSPYAPGGI